jgi:porin
MRAPIVSRLKSAVLSSAFLASCWILASPGTADAQQAAPPPPPTAAPAPPPPPQPPPGYMFDMSGVGKAWGDMLKSYGIYLNGGSETNMFGFVSGGRKTGINMQGENTLGADIDMNRLAGIPGAAIHISTDERWGQNPARYFGAGVVTTANYGPTDAYRLGELSWDQDLFNDHVRILVGRIADNIDFSANDQAIYCQFLLVTCGQANGWYFNTPNPSYPVSTWGGRITIKPSLTTYFRVGAYQETSIEAAGNHFGWPGASWDFGHDEGVFIPIEIGYKTNFDQSPFPTGFDIGGYYDSSHFIEPGTAALSNPRQGRSGLYLQASQMIFRPDMNSHRGLTVFGEALWDTADNGPVAEQYVAGFTWTGPCICRPADRLQFAANYWSFNRNYVQAFSAMTTGLGLPPLGTRTSWQLELDYAYQMAPGIQLIPVVAYQINPDMGEVGYALPLPTSRLRNSWMVGAQLAIGLNGAFGLPAFARTN